MRPTATVSSRHHLEHRVRAEPLVERIAQAKQARGAIFQRMSEFMPATTCCSARPPASARSTCPRGGYGKYPVFRLTTTSSGCGSRRRSRSTSCPVVALRCELTEGGLPVARNWSAGHAGSGGCCRRRPRSSRCSTGRSRAAGPEGRLTWSGGSHPAPAGSCTWETPHGAACVVGRAGAWRQDAADASRDLDRDRCRPEYAQAIRDDLAWLGLDWDAETRPQSLGDPDYALALERVSQQGLVYECFCTRRELAAVASAPHGSDDQPAAYPAPAAS